MAAAAALFSTFNDVLGKRIAHATKKIRIENFAFTLSTKVTVGALFLCASLVTMQSLIGEHIKCIKPPNDDVRGQALDQYCFVTSTYTLPHLYNASVPDEIPHFAVGPHVVDVHEQKYHSYYQWVPFVLFFLAMLFYTPHALWKAWEDKRIHTYCNIEVGDKEKYKFHQRILVGEEEAKKVDSQIGVGADCFHNTMVINGHVFYAGAYILCEILNFVIVVVSIFLLDSFLGNEFTTYGPEVIKYVYSDNPEERVDPMNKVFPKVAKCDFHKFGPSGNLIRYDILCVLALNILNEKIFVVLWFWFVILAIISGLNLLYRLVAIFVPVVRTRMILREIKPDQRAKLAVLFNRLPYADWFLLKRISANSTHSEFTWLCKKLNEIVNPEIDYARRYPSVHSLGSGSGKVPSVQSPPPNYYSAKLNDDPVKPVGYNPGSGLLSSVPENALSPYSRNDSSEDEPMIRHRADPSSQPGFS